MTVTHNRAASRYEMHTEAGLAVALYRERDGVRLVHHTEVPQALEGRGLGSALVKGMFEDMRREGVKMRPACSFVQDWLARHPDFSDLLP